MMRYESFGHEAKRLHAIRLAHLIYPNGEGPKTWDEASPRRRNYAAYLDRKWSHLMPYSLLKAEIRRVYFLNPADLGRWGGDFPAWRIGNHHRSWMMPTKLIATACSDEDVDSKLRDLLCAPSTTQGVGQVEVLSWFGYSPKPPAWPGGTGAGEEDSILTGAFRLVGKRRLQQLRPLFTQIALIFLQHQSIHILTDVNRFFEDLDVLTAGNWTKKHSGTAWTPLLCGLLKGNIDGFVLLGKTCNDEAVESEAEQLISRLTDRALRRQDQTNFWNRVSAVAVYFGIAAENDIVQENLVLLDRLPLPVRWK